MTAWVPNLPVIFWHVIKHAFRASAKDCTFDSMMPGVFQTGAVSGADWPAASENHSMWYQK